jgi:Family of unknown function (DUF6504)
VLLPVFPKVADGVAGANWRRSPGTQGTCGQESATVREVRWEPVEVWLNDGRPSRFGWRGRIYTVLATLERPLVEDRLAEDQAESQGRPDPEPGDPDRASWLCWRVSASPSKNVPPQTYQLCRNAASGRWVLSRNGS